MMFWKKLFLPKPFNSDFFPEKDGHRVYFEEYGNKSGKPVIVFHGGPGGRMKPMRVESINLKKYRVIFFDQRGCGKSEPSGELKHNTTQALLDDVSRLVSLLKIQEKIILWGASWGSTLALLWAEQNPQKVDKLLLSQVFLANEDSKNWEFGGTCYIYPEFVDFMAKEACGNITSYYNDLIQSNDAKKQLQAANVFGWYERVCGSMEPQFNNMEELSEADLASYRIYMHYAVNDFFLRKNQILDDIDTIKDVETLMIHNRLDLICPYKGAFDVQQHLKNSKLIVVPDFGHVSKKLIKVIRKEISKVLS